MGGLVISDDAIKGKYENREEKKTIKWDIKEKRLK
jgi:hypothetical protein